MLDYIFVYGTLRVGCGAYRSFGLDRGTQHVGTFAHPGQMFSLGGFPGVRLDREGEFMGDLLRVTSVTPKQLLERLDQYEGYRADSERGSLYLRREIEVTTPDGPVKAYVYEYNQPNIERPAIIDWMEYKKLA